MHNAPSMHGTRLLPPCPHTQLAPGARLPCVARARLPALRPLRLDSGRACVSTSCCLAAPRRAPSSGVAHLGESGNTPAALPRGAVAASAGAAGLSAAESGAAAVGAERLPQLAEHEGNSGSGGASASSAAAGQGQGRQPEVVHAREQQEEPQVDQQPEAAAASSSKGLPDGGGQLLTALPPPTNMKVKTAEYVKSSVTVAQCPPAKLPEFAIIGRSNVGKSSLINMLTGKQALAMVSKTPGKTKCINHFLINDSWYLVDLPGYGYAKTGRENRLAWSKFTKAYFLDRATLVSVLVLVDASIPPQPIDLQCCSWLVDAEVPFMLVFTKTDKKKKGEPRPADNIKAFKEALAAEFSELPFVVETSARTAEGRQALLALIAQLRQLFLDDQKKR